MVRGTNSCGQHALFSHLNILMLIFSSMNVIYPIIINHITTLLNYRMAVPVGSYFLAYNIFPEVYQAHWTSKAPFSGGERAVAGQGENTTYSVTSSGWHRYILCQGAAARRCGSRRSGTGSFRILAEEKIDYCMRVTKSDGLLLINDYCI